MVPISRWPLLLLTATSVLLCSCNGSLISSSSTVPAATNGKSTPVISWPQPAPIAAGTPLGIAQLGATANVAGAFAYSPAAGTVLSAGTQMLSASFTPEDTADYTTATASVTITVNAPAGNLPPAGNTTSHLYVLAIPNTPPHNASTYGYSVAENGQLTPIPGFPLPYDISGVISGSYLFATDVDRFHIDSYLINSDGSFTKVQSFDDSQAIQARCSLCVLGGPVLTDRSGLNLYVLVNDPCSCSWFPYLQTFTIDPITGAVGYESSDIAVGGVAWGFGLGSFSSNDTYLYGDSDGSGISDIGFVTRAPSGSLSGNPEPNAIVGLPASPPALFYGSSVIGTDSANHLAAVIQSYDNLNQTDLPLMLASFTINANGTLTTTNGLPDMPTVPTAYDEFAGAVSPDGTLIALSGASGIQIFNFNGAAPITVNTGVFPTDPIAQVLWDNQNHLYALSYTQKLYVFNVTSASTAPAPGSPYSIPNSLEMMVQP